MFYLIPSIETKPGYSLFTQPLPKPSIELLNSPLILKLLYSKQQGYCIYLFIFSTFIQKYNIVTTNKFVFYKILFLANIINSIIYFNIFKK